MNKFKKLSAIILVFCSLAAFASCSDKTDSSVTTTLSNENTTITVDAPSTPEIINTVTEIQTVAVSVTDKKGNVSVSVSEKVVVIPQTTNQAVSDPTRVVTNAPLKNPTTKTVTNEAPITATTKPLQTTVKTTKAVKTTVATTKKPVVDDVINEKSVGIFMMTKTDPVQIGNYATVYIQGTPDKTYSIDFYESPSVAMKSDKLESKKADANGFVSWSFEIDGKCSLGKRKVVIKEEGSGNYLETSITVR